MFASSRRIETCIAWPWKVKVKIWPQVKVTAWPKLHISRSVLTRQTHWDHFHVSSCSQSQVICKNLLVTSVTSDELSGVTGQHLTLGHHEWPKSTWSWKNYTLLMRLEGFQYFPHWLIMERSGSWPDPRSSIYQKSEIYKLYVLVALLSSENLKGFY